MKINKKIDNPHVLYLAMEAEFGKPIGFSGDDTGITLYEESEEVKEFIENWTETRTDEEQVDEENEAKELEKFLKMLNKDEVKDKILKIKDK